MPTFALRRLRPPMASRLLGQPATHGVAIRRCRDAQTPKVGNHERARREEGRGHRRRQAVHVLHVAGHTQEAGALPDHDGERHRGHARLPAPRQRAAGPSAPRRPVVQLRRRGRLRLLEQLRRDQAGAEGEDGVGQAPRGGQGREQGRPRRARGEGRLGLGRRQDAPERDDDFTFRAAPAACG